MSGEQLLVDLNTLGSVRCETWNRKARLDLQDRVMETLQGEETLSILEQFDTLNLSKTAASRLLPIYSKGLAEYQSETKLQMSFLQLLSQSERISMVRKSIELLKKKESKVDWFSLAQSVKEAPLQLAAIGIGHGIDPKHDWLSLLLEAVLQHFPSDLTLVQDVIQKSSNEEQRSTVSAALLGKTKSHISKALPTVTAWIKYLHSGGVFLEATEDWQVHVCKSLVAVKDMTRTEFGELVVAWNQPAVWARVICERQSGSSPISPLARVDLYTLFSELGDRTQKELEVDVSVATAVVEKLVGLVEKEKSEGRVLGIKALLSWTLLLSQENRTKPLQLVRKAWAVKPATDTTARAVFATLVEMPVDSLKGLVEGLVTGSKDTSLSPWTTAAATKKALRYEGVVAMYLSLLRCHVAKESVPVWVHTAFKSSLLSVSESSWKYINEVPLLRTLAMYVELGRNSTSDTFVDLSKGGSIDAIAHSMLASKPDFDSLALILKSNSQLAEALVAALERQVAHCFQAQKKAKNAVNATRAAREMDSVIDAPMFDLRGVRLAALELIDLSIDQVVKLMVLMHVGGTTRCTGRQRNAMIQRTRLLLNAICQKLGDDRESLIKSWAEQLVGPCPNSYWQEGTSSLLISLGSIGGAETYGEESLSMGAATFARDLCVAVSAGLGVRLKECFAGVLAITDRQIGIYHTPAGVLFEESKQSLVDQTKKKNLTEDEVWEVEMKKELAKRSGADKKLTAEQRLAMEKQEQQFLSLETTLAELLQVLNTIYHLVSSDIEVGNACLVQLADPVLIASVARCPAASLPSVYHATSRTLASLAEAVYEIEERYAPDLATALSVSCTFSGSSLEATPLPAPCLEAATIVSEINAYGDLMSPGSFCFLFPLIRATLMGPRSPAGCEEVMEVIERHAGLFSTDPYVSPYRKDMIAALLGLMNYDRSQIFQKPTTLDTLISCCTTDGSSALTQGELAPLLDKRGSLGTRSCRRASMVALAAVASDNIQVVKSNPLAENRVWLNCFDCDEGVANEAQKVWRIIHGISDTNESSKILPPPNTMFAAPLLPLLHSKDNTIAEAAASAYAAALALHPNSIARNMENLCKAYIDAFPDQEISLETKTSVPHPVKKKPAISTGLPKKRAAAKKSALAVAGIGKPKAMKKKVASSSLLKPKQERTLDQTELDNQFFKGGSGTKEKDSTEKIVIRRGVIQAIAATTDGKYKAELDEFVLKQVTTFLMAYGIADSSDAVKGSARDALRDVVATNGGSDEAIAFLLPHLEAVLKTGVVEESSIGALPVDKIPRDIAASDRRKEGTVVALGSIALHLKGDENLAKVDSTVDMLVAALKTPSEDVQSSVANALTKLMKKGNTQNRIGEILDDLMNICLHGGTLAERRGAAYGLSAAVKGSGIAALKKFHIVKRLETACSSGDPNSKEGSLFAMELLCSRLGLLFEPYVIVLLPSLLRSFSDGSDHVRSAASHAAGLIMSKLSAHGVKLVMPAVLKSFEDPAWRTKQASIHMLGSMSHLAPKQLASALPKVVPKLTEAFSDTHPKVKQSAQEALSEISGVIRNPEISSISGILLKALTDPADNTVAALEGLIETEFLHSIDAPSLALIVPILHRGLRDRGANTKRYGGLIAGNICTTLVPDLQTSLLDPIPDVRSTSAKALGSLTRSLGDFIVADLRPWLLKKLRDPECSSAERSGAAQGLTEVLVASGAEVVDVAMRNEILPLRSYPDASTREGVLWMLTFLPPTMGLGFTPLIDVSLPALINGLSDDSEPVRDVSMRAGRVLIRTHGKVHVDKILPNLEAGLLDEDYRIRLSSLSLLGDLLSTIGGTIMVKGDGDTQDDIRRAERAQAQIAVTLGPDTRRRVYSSLYFARSDSTHAVRSRAIQVWKTIVSVTARTLRDILPVLVNHIIENLAGGHDERTEIAGKCLGDIVGKLGEAVLPQIMPVLRKTLTQGDASTKRGVCVGLTEIIEGSTKDQILRYLDIIVRVVQEALSDSDKEVRTMAATSFQSLYKLVGNRAFDEVVPALMVALDNDITGEIQRNQALNGLTGILSLRSRELLPYIIPRLIEAPISPYHANALASIAEVTGDTISNHFTTIIPALLLELTTLDDTQPIDRCLKTLCGSVNVDGVKLLVGEAVSSCASDKATLRRDGCRLFEFIVTERASMKDYYDQNPIILRELLGRLNDDDSAVLKSANLALAALSKHVEAEELAEYVEFMRNLLASLVSDARRRKGGVGDGEFFLPGFSMPKGVEPLLPIYQRGILYGAPDVREAAAAGIGEILQITPSKYLAGPLIIKITGPLLRVVGDRNPSTVKVAILKTLGLILKKGGPALRAFVPQFQTTFVKALSDPSRQVRVEAIGALSLLMALSTRVDPLIKELVAGSIGKTSAVEGTGAAAVQTATLHALAVVLDKAGSKAKLPTTIPSTMDASLDLLNSGDEGIRRAAASSLAQACSLLGKETTATVLSDLLSNSELNRHGVICSIGRILAAPAGEAVPDISRLQDFVTEFLEDEDSATREAVCVALGAVIGRSSDIQLAFRENETSITKLLQKDETLEIHRAVARGLCIALQLTKASSRISSMGLSLLDSCLKAALSGSQRVQFAFNDVLWLALDVANGPRGLDDYCSRAVFDNQRKMTSLHSKVLSKIKRVSVLDDL